MRNLGRAAWLAGSIVLGASVVAHAVPVLQVGAPGTTPGTYAPYVGTSTDPAETDTAITTGSTLYAAGTYQNNNVLSLGGQYGPVSGLSGLNWSDFSFAETFDTRGAVLMATVPDGTLGGSGNSITVGGLPAFYSTSTYEEGFTVPNPPSNHAPIPGQDYLFFDIGDFSEIVEVPDFADATQGTKLGEIKTLTIAITGYAWAHFDLFALETLDQIIKERERGQVLATYLKTNEVGNPGSHDVTWKKDGGGGGGGNPVPEPGTMLLLGSGLLGLAGAGRKKVKK